MKRIVRTAAAGLASAWMATGSTGWTSVPNVDLVMSCSYDGTAVTITNLQSETIFAGTKMHVFYVSNSGGVVTDELYFPLDAPLLQGHSILQVARTGSDGFETDCKAWAMDVPPPPPPPRPPIGGAKNPSEGPPLKQK